MSIIRCVIILGLTLSSIAGASVPNLGLERGSDPGLEQEEIILIPKSVQELGFAKTHFSLTKPSTISSDTPFVNGWTYVYMGNHKFPGETSCEKMFAAMDQAISHDQFFGEQLYGRTFMGCWTDPQDQPIELFVQVVVEPTSDAAIPYFKEYLERTQKTTVGDTRLHFLPVKQIFSKFELLSLFINDSLYSEVLKNDILSNYGLYSGSLKSDNFYNNRTFRGRLHHNPSSQMDTSFLDQKLLARASTYRLLHSLREDHGFHDQIRENYWKPMDIFLKLIEKFFGTYYKKHFRNYALPRSNGVLTDYDRVYVVKTDDGSEHLMKNYIVQVVPFRNCKSYPNQHCL